MKSLAKYWNPKITGIRITHPNDKDLFEETGSSWVYGEVSEQGIEEMMSGLPEHDKGLFIDLGSGRGNICAFVYANYGYRECVGIELSRTRWELSNEIKESASEEHDLSGVHFLCENLFEYDFTQADVLYTNNLAFSTEANSRLYRKLNKEMKAGSFFMATRWISDISICPRLRQVAKMSIKSSWMDTCPMFIYMASQ